MGENDLLIGACAGQGITMDCVHEGGGGERGGRMIIIKSCKSQFFDGILRAFGERLDAVCVLKLERVGARRSRTAVWYLD